MEFRNILLKVEISLYFASFAIYNVNELHNVIRRVGMTIFLDSIVPFLLAAALHTSLGQCLKLDYIYIVCKNLIKVQRCDKGEETIFTNAGSFCQKKRIG